MKTITSIVLQIVDILMNLMFFEQVITRGPACETAFQSKRVFGKARCPSGIFDSQITPRNALLEYLSNNFIGMFERRDLELRGTCVINRRLGTQHPHEFKDFPIDARYQLARRRVASLVSLIAASPASDHH